MKPVTLAVFNSREEAEPVQRLLRDRGISAEIRLERGETVFADYARSVSGVRVEVSREDFEEALTCYQRAMDLDDGKYYKSWLE